MTRRSSILGILRRRRAGVGRIVLAWFVLASASLGAAPCFVMASTVAPTAQRDAVPLDVSGHGHSHATAHDHAAAQPEPDATPPPSSPCPHCPPSVAIASGGATGAHGFSAHGVCSAADDVSDGGKSPVPSVIALKTLASVPIVELLPFDPGPRLGREQHRPSDAIATAIALNLRHCVFLI